jgi:glycosyltransferase involved in cell wall biosynthesis
MTQVSRETPPAQRRYCLISPCRDEAQFMRRTLDSVLAQSIPPARWVIVDDGSKDQSPQILQDYAARYPIIQVVRRQDRGRRLVGPGVIDAFYAGYNAIDPAQFDYMCKLDLDLDMPPGYFEEMMRRMEAEPRLGTCSGKPYFPAPSNKAKDFNGRLISECVGDETSVGAVKFYRTPCFQQIGGFVRGVMWDGIDCHRCRMLGWIACSWDEPAIRFIHLRPMGSSHKGLWIGRARHGYGQYFMGTGPFYVTFSALYRFFRPPLVTGALAMWAGYFRSVLLRYPRYDDLEFRRFLRRYQRWCLVLGKSEATRRVNHLGAAVWRPQLPEQPPVPAVTVSSPEGSASLA